MKIAAGLFAAYLVLAVVGVLPFKLYFVIGGVVLLMVMAFAGKK